MHKHRKHEHRHHSEHEHHHHSDINYESSARNIYAEDDDIIYADEEESLYGGFSSKSDYHWNNFQNYMRSSRMMVAHSFSHLKNPVTIFIILLLSVCYILLNVAGNIGFSFSSGKIVQYVTTNLDIVVNAFLGFFFGPATSAISVTLCCIAKMIVRESGFFIGYVISSAAAGFIHGWILYSVRNTWFRPWSDSFHIELALRVLVTRLFVSVVVNIGLMSLIFKIFAGYPFISFILNYSKSDVPLNSFGEFMWIFFVSIIFESVIVFVSLVLANFIAINAFPGHMNEPSIYIGQNGDLESFEDFDD